MYLILLVAAAIAGIVCVFALVHASYVALQLKDAKKARRLDSWDMVDIFDAKSVKPASKLVFWFHLSIWATFAALILICAGFLLICRLKIPPQDTTQICGLLFSGSLVAVISLRHMFPYGTMVRRHVLMTID